MGKYHYGGQAVMEGVMMRGERNMAVAVRKPDGDILVHSEPLSGRFYKTKWVQYPFIRGVAMLWDTLVLGIRTLMFSADVALGEEDIEFSGPIAWGTVAVSFVVGIGLFFVLPLVLVNFIDQWVTSALVSNIIEGVLRLGMFLAYVWAIGFIPDIQRVFAYHGAEHRTVNALESGDPLTPEAVQQHTTAHTRCGTAFLLTVAVISIFVFAFLGRPPLLLRYASRILLIPVIAGLAYEWLRLSADHYDWAWVRWLTKPGLALQRLTTRVPDDGMAEVAIAALSRVLEMDAEAAPAQEPIVEAVTASE